MAIAFQKKLPALMGLKVSRAVLVSGILTFLYIVEFCIGIRTVYYLFCAWHDTGLTHVTGQSVSLAHWLGCLLFCLVTTFSINALSATWEQRQMVEEEKPRSVLLFSCHVMFGGVLWRYVTLWWNERKDLQKKGALTLTILKFLFTQSFTIPIVVLHVSFLDTLEEISFVVVSALCVAVSVSLTCVIFYWCSAEVEQLSTWDLESLALVPLLFRQNDLVQPPKNESPQVQVDSIEDLHQNEPSPPRTNQAENAIKGFLVLLQTFSFTFGRLLALGILLKLAGVYAVSIMILQFLASVIYLKFQTPLLVSDSLPKWKQLTRLAFLSYTLIFEWHLHRNHKTGYDFSAKVKHSISYYCITILESIFYIVAWLVAKCNWNQPSFDMQSEIELKFTSDVALMACLSVVFSLVLHISLIIWQSRRLEMLAFSVRRNLENRRLGKVSKQNNTGIKKRAELHISSPKLFNANEISTGTISEVTLEENSSNLEIHSSYKDLKEPIDDEIEIYVRQNGRKDNKLIDENTYECGKYSKEDICKRSDNQFIDVALKTEEEIKVKSNSTEMKRAKLEDVELSQKIKKTFSNVRDVLPVKHKTSFDDETTLEMSNTSSKIEATTSDKNIRAKDKTNGNSKISNTDTAYQEACDLEETEVEKNAIGKFTNTVFQKFNKLAEISRNFAKEIRSQMKKEKVENGNPESSFADLKSNSIPQTVISNKIEFPDVSASENKDIDVCAGKSQSIKFNSKIMKSNASERKNKKLCAETSGNDVSKLNNVTYAKDEVGNTYTSDETSHCEDNNNTMSDSEFANFEAMAEDYKRSYNTNESLRFEDFDVHDDESDCSYERDREVVDSAKVCNESNEDDNQDAYIKNFVSIAENSSTEIHQNTWKNIAAVNGKNLHHEDSTAVDESECHERSSCSCDSCVVYRIQFQKCISQREDSKTFAESIPNCNVETSSHSASPEINFEKGKIGENHTLDSDFNNCTTKPKRIPLRITMEGMKVLSILKTEDRVEHYV